MLHITLTSKSTRVNGGEKKDRKEREKREARLYGMYVREESKPGAVSDISLREIKVSFYIVYILASSYHSV